MTDNTVSVNDVASLNRELGNYHSNW